MKKLSKNIIPKLLILLGFGLLLPLAWYQFGTEKKAQPMQKSESFTQVLPELLESLNERWRLGDIEGLLGSEKFKCSDIPSASKYGSEFLKCNPLYLHCLLVGKLDSIAHTFSKKDYTIALKNKDANPSYKVLDNGDIAFDLIETKTQTEFAVRLERSCHDVYLPKKVYSAGPKDFNEHIWDNYMQNIFLDKNYVSKLDVLIWKKHLGEIKNWEVKEDLLLPETKLNLEERKKYCQAQGKRLLSARVFDAASYYPEESQDKFFYKHPYPWKKGSRSFLRKVYKTGTSFSKDDCSKALIKGCQEDPYLYEGGISWTGIHHALGGYAESFSNDYKPKANLKVSSIEMKRLSGWHKNGMKAYWKGEDISHPVSYIEQHTGKRLPGSIEKGVAFRCMKLK